MFGVHNVATAAFWIKKPKTASFSRSKELIEFNIYSKELMSIKGTIMKNIERNKMFVCSAPEFNIYYY